MPSFEYRSLKEHLNEVGIYFRQAVDIILQEAREGAKDGEFEFYPEDYEYDFNFLEDRELIAEMLAERPEVAFVEHHNNGFSLRLQEPAPSMSADEIAFAAQMQQIDGADMGKLGAWMAHARSLADVDAEALSVSADRCYRKVLGDFGSIFQEMEQKYPGSAAAIFNYKEGYLHNELLPAADWIHNGGTAEEAYDMAQAGAFELGTYVAREPKAITQAELEAMAERHNINLNNQLEGECADFSGRLLYGLEMRNMNLCGANFNGAVLRECDMGNSSFDDCDFTGAAFHAVQAGDATFEQSNFTGTRFEGCNFFYADFECGDFTRAVFEDTNLYQATLDGCTFYGAQFESTDLSEASTTLAKGLPDSKAQALVEILQARHMLWRYGEPDGRRADFTCKGLTSLDFTGKNFDSAIFFNAELYRCDFTGCSLDSADFTGAKLYDCIFTDAVLDDADFSQAELMDCEGLDDISQGPAMAMGGGMA